MKYIKLFESFLNESLKQDIQELKKEMAEKSITKVVINDLVYQRRYNGVDVDIDFFSGKKEIKIDELDEMLFNIIKKAWKDNRAIKVEELIKFFGDIIYDPKGKKLSANDFIDIETGTDS